MFHIFIAGFSRVKVRLTGLKSPGALHSAFTIHNDRISLKV